MTEDALSLLDAIAESPRLLSSIEILRLRSEILRLRSDLLDYEHTFDLRTAADRRAIRRWQDEQPGRELKRPDHADLVVWLFKRLSEAEESIELVPHFDEL